MELLRMSDEQPHPSVSAPMSDIPYYERERTVRDMRIQVTCSRLALTVLIFGGSDGPFGPRFVVWDWKTGVKYVVGNNKIHWYWDSN